MSRISEALTRWLPDSLVALGDDSLLVPGDSPAGSRPPGTGTINKGTATGPLIAYQTLGKPVWVLLAAQPDWRWGKDRADSVWYPSARVFRQSTLGDWSGVVAQLQAALGTASR